MKTTNLFNYKLSKKERKEKKERYRDLTLRKIKAKQTKELFGKPNKETRKQLFDLHKDSKDFKRDLELMKNILKGGKRK